MLYHVIPYNYRFKVIFWIMIIQGLGGLLPFNMFINAYEVCVCVCVCVCVYVCVYVCVCVSVA